MKRLHIFPRVLLLVICLWHTGKQAAAQQATDLQAAMKNAYKGVFYANDFRYLNDPRYAGPYFLGDSLKGLWGNRVDVGGEFRSRYHHENNHRGLGLTGRDDQFWLTRLRLFTNYRVNDWLRVYGEYLYADSAGEDFAPRPIEENRGEAQNLFVDVKLLDGLTVRGGRQELLLGAQRLVSPLDWANTRRTFDGYRLMLSQDQRSLDAFYTNPVARVAATGGTNEWDSADTDQHFYGIYASDQSTSWGTLEAYYLGYNHDRLDFSYHTLGSRLVGKNDLFLYELEGGVQFGENSDGSEHGAGFATIGIGKQLCWYGWKPTVWGWYDWASGGDSGPVSRGDDSFDHLFPLAHKYNGFLDLFGRRNLNDVNMQFIAPVGNRVSLLLWYHYFFLDQPTTPYGVTMQPYNAGNAAGSRDLGHEIDLLCTVTVNPRHQVLVGYSWFGAGRYYDTTPGVLSSADADFFYMQYQTRF
ncbi:MAG: hypothetical protein KatS3mg111_0047 [Pirellulaceae bacterium]|nr:MAG: hypothetical protein KatS3mg111_0047 [Pirellulaceae bacterium]